MAGSLAILLACALLLVAPLDILHHIEHLRADGHDEQDSSSCSLCLAAHHGDSVSRVDAVQVAAPSLVWHPPTIEPRCVAFAAVLASAPPRAPPSLRVVHSQA